MNLEREQKQEVIRQFQTHPTDTGSSETQIALLTARIRELTAHLQAHRKDRSTTLGLQKLVGQRRRLLRYLAGEDENRYRRLIERLALRR
ncbi:MAG: 30S ribosomal protein S15 [Chloroflexi bacterium]|nr:30S ribosomal protein S15 [Chloroflexota bacterium]